MASTIGRGMSPLFRRTSKLLAHGITEPKNKLPSIDRCAPFMWWGDAVGTGVKKNTVD